jgi:hypothetical protein
MLKQNTALINYTVLCKSVKTLLHHSKVVSGNYRGKKTKQEDDEKSPLDI